ncbi:hypothetical protein, partial [Bartonella sp. CL48QHWL]|uniref:hypothetical protein n=1 Tax=Bartonella sp. CL48QHWL TaxID=3243535 RepID=UPI0035D11C73
MDTNQSSEQYLRELYYNPDSPVAYSSLNKIWKQVKEDRTSSREQSSGKLIKVKELKEFLETLPTHQLHKPAIKKFTFRKTMVSYIDQQWQADLVDMQKFESKNKGFRFILTVIDLFSRYSWALPVKSKRGEEIRDAFKLIFREAKPE